MRKKSRTLEKTLESYALSSFKGAVMLYHHLREKGFSEDYAIKRGVNYVFGQITSSGMLKDHEKRQRLAYDLAAVQGLTKAMLEQLKQIDPEIN